MGLRPLLSNGTQRVAQYAQYNMAVPFELNKSPFDTPRARFLAGRMGMSLFLISLGMLFAASLLGFIAVRLLTNDVWPSELPALPRLLWLSTALIVISSGTMQWALEAIRRDGRAILKGTLLATFALGVGFLVVQIICWMNWLAQIEAHWADSETYRFALTSFYVLTGVHAAHVIGGLIPMAFVLWRAFRGRYHAQHHPGVHYVAMYWHFLDVVWFVLFVTLLLGT